MSFTLEIIYKQIKTIYQLYQVVVLILKLCIQLSD